MPSRLTRQGAYNITSMLDRVANVIQHRASVLGIPADVALDFAKRADLLSDAIEKRAAANFPLPKDEDDKTEDSANDKAPDEPKTAGCEKLPEGGMRENCEKKKEEGEAADKKAAADFPVQPGKDETGTSVDHGTAGFDANAIGDDRGGPRLQEEPWMAGHFSQESFHTLRDKVEKNILPTVGEVDAKLASLRDLVAGVQASLKAMEKEASMQEDNDWGFRLTK